MHRRITFTFTLATLAAAGVVSFASAADRKSGDSPAAETLSTAQPTALIKCRSDNQALLDDVRPHYEAALKVVQEAEGKNEKQLERFNAKMVGEGYAGAERMMRLGMRLKELGDPSGHDLQARGQVMAGQIRQVAKEIIRVNKQKIDATFPALVNQAEKLEKGVKRSVDAQASGGDWTAAEKELQKAFDELWEGAVFCDGNQQTIVFNRFQTHDATIMRKQVEAARRKVLADSAAAGTAYAEAAKELLKRLDEAATQVGTSGATEVTGESLTGPEAFAKLAEQWGAVQALGAKARGFAFAVLTSAPRGQVDLVDLESDAAKNSKKIAEGLAKIIEKDAARASAADVAERYAAYLQAVAPSLARASEPAYQPAVAKALDALAAKNAEFAKTAGAYNLVTGDLLRWRRRAGEAEAARLRDPEHALTRVFPAAASETSESDRYFPPNAKGAADAQIIGSPSEALAAAWGRMKNKPVVATNAQLARPSESTWAGCDQHLTAVLAGTTPAAETAKTSLKRLLLVGENQPALGLDAAVAAHRADANAWVEAGGSLEEVKIFGLSTTWADAPSDPTLSLSLGPFAKETPANSFLSEVHGVFRVTPEWILGDGYLAVAKP